RTLFSGTEKEPTAHQPLRGSTSEHCLSMTFLSGLPGLNQFFPSSGYFPYSRTEGELCTVPAPGDRFLLKTEDSENEEGGQVEETDIKSLCPRCLVS
ncbi:hypothetical protein N332_08027, partial [Mesitornis unicolor]